MVDEDHLSAPYMGKEEFRERIERKMKELTGASTLEEANRRASVISEWRGYNGE